MNQLHIFKNSDFGEIRTLAIDNEPWFVGRDVAEILGYKNISDTLTKHVDSEDKGVAK
jgi:prophage antirepressor-like protein